jgi:hypothetical protein
LFDSTEEVVHAGEAFATRAYLRFVRRCFAGGQTALAFRVTGGDTLVDHWLAGHPFLPQHDELGARRREILELRCRGRFIADLREPRLPFGAPHGRFIVGGPARPFGFGLTLRPSGLLLFGRALSGFLFETLGFEALRITDVGRWCGTGRDLGHGGRVEQGVGRHGGLGFLRTLLHLTEKDAGAFDGVLVFASSGDLLELVSILQKVDRASRGVLVLAVQGHGEDLGELMTVTQRSKGIEARSLGCRMTGDRPERPDVVDMCQSAKCD